MGEGGWGGGGKYNKNKQNKNHIIEYLYLVCVICGQPAENPGSYCTYRLTLVAYHL